MLIAARFGVKEGGKFPLGVERDLISNNLSRLKDGIDRMSSSCGGKASKIMEDARHQGSRHDKYLVSFLKMTSEIHLFRAIIEGKQHEVGRDKENRNRGRGRKDRLSLGNRA